MSLYVVSVSSKALLDKLRKIKWCVERRLDLSGTYFHDELPFTDKISRQINRTQTKVK